LKLNAEEKEENLSFDAKSTELVDFIFDEGVVRVRVRGPVCKSNQIEIIK